MLRVVRRVLLPSLLCLMLPAIAVAESDFFQTGPYIGLDAALALENFRGSSTGPSAVPAGNARVGYRLNRIFSAELLGEFTDDLNYTPPGPWQKARIWSVSANLKGAVDMSGWHASLGRIQPYAVGGVGYYQAWLFNEPENPGAPNSSIQDGMARLGAGIDVYLVEHLLVAFEARYNFMFNGKRALDYWSFSMGPQYRF